jgi:hypothetical protein
MKSLFLFKRQFLFTKDEGFDLPWERNKILDYTLFHHPDLEFEHSINKKVDLYLLGFLFDYEKPQYSNKQILDILSNSDNYDNFLERLSKYSGHYVIIYKSEAKLIILNDPCAQSEIYYNNSFTSFGTQPKIINKVNHVVLHTSIEAAEFYNSSMFHSKKVFIGETTHAENIKHLLPNHFIDIKNKMIIRYFPNEKIKIISLDEAATEASTMLEGYIKAAALRNNLYMGVTGGYDSRVLFLSSLGVPCKYYVTQLSNMKNNHYDIKVSIRAATCWHEV